MKTTHRETIPQPFGDLVLATSIKARLTFKETLLLVIPMGCLRLLETCEEIDRPKRKRIPVKFPRPDHVHD